VLFVPSAFVPPPFWSRFKGIPHDWQFLKLRSDAMRIASHESTPSPRHAALGRYDLPTMSAQIRL